MLRVGFMVLSERRALILYQNVRPTTRASGMYRMAYSSLEMLVKRVAFPRYVRALITICVCLHGVGFILLMLLVVGLDPSTIWLCLKHGGSVHVATWGVGLRLDLLLVTKIFPEGIDIRYRSFNMTTVWKCVPLQLLFTCVEQNVTST